MRVSKTLEVGSIPTAPAKKNSCHTPILSLTSRTMDYLSDLVDRHTNRIQEIATIANINGVLIEIAVNDLKSIKNDLDATGRNIPIRTKVERQIEKYKMVARLPDLQPQFSILRGQIVVLIIGSQEAFLGDAIKLVADKDPDKLVWQDEKEKISFEPMLLSAGFTLGDIIMAHLKNRNYSFQDLKSSLDAIERYLGAQIQLDGETRDILILASAWRNVIVHNKSEVDHAFLRQLRGTAYKDAYKFGEELDISEEDISTLISATTSFASKVVDGIKSVGLNELPIAPRVV